MEQVLIGFGSNLGDSAQICREAIGMLGNNAEIQVSSVSSLYRTEPVGMVDQDWFVNGVILCGTSLEPLELWDVIRGIEEDFGRVRTIRWGPRSLDLDILSYGERQIDLPGLTVPHPRMHERLFVLVPLVEIAPHWVHPVYRKSAGELLEALRAGACSSAVQLLEG